MISKHNNFYKIFLLNPNQIITNYCDWLVLTSVKKCNMYGVARRYFSSGLNNNSYQNNDQKTLINITLSQTVVSPQ